MTTDTSQVHSFSGHETFPFRYPWLKKGLDAVSDDPEIFLREDALVTLGVGKNMVRSIRHWCLATGLLEDGKEAGTPRKPGVRPTRLGRLLLGDRGLDPFLEDPATLWLLHWQLASNRARASTWFWAFSHFHEPEFTREQLTSGLQAWAQTLGGKPVSSSSLRRDVECFLRTYVAARPDRGAPIEDSLDCPLAELRLIAPDADGRFFRFRRGPQDDLPDHVLFYAVLSFWESAAKDAGTLALHDLCRRPGGPGRLFKIDDSSLAARLEEAERVTSGGLVYDETAGLRQLYRRQTVDPFDLLARAYRSGEPRKERRR